MERWLDHAEPFLLAEQRERNWDRFAGRLPVCAGCSHRILPGDRWFRIPGIALCDGCFSDLQLSEAILDGEAMHFDFCRKVGKRR